MGQWVVGLRSVTAKIHYLLPLREFQIVVGIDGVCLGNRSIPTTVKISPIYASKNNISVNISKGAIIYFSTLKQFQFETYATMDMLGTTRQAVWYMCNSCCIA